MPNYAIYENNKIENIVVADSKEIVEDLYGKNAIEAIGKISIGWILHEDGTWRSPRPFPSWQEWDFDEEEWLPPIPKPSPYSNVYWDEDSLSWERYPSPFPSWEWNGESWFPPTRPPNDDFENYRWNESTTSWVLKNSEGE